MEVGVVTEIGKCILFFDLIKYRLILFLIFFINVPHFSNKGVLLEKIRIFCILIISCQPLERTKTYTEQPFFAFEKNSINIIISYFLQ
jgi:hypothetical protein